MKKFFVFTALLLFVTVLTQSCTKDELPTENEVYQVDRDKIRRPGEQGSATVAEDVDRDKIRRPGSQGND